MPLGHRATIAWLNRYRRLAKDWENLNRKALMFLRLASIRLMPRKLCNPAPDVPRQIPNSTVSRIYAPRRSCDWNIATWASWQASDESADQLSTHGRDRVWD